MTAQDRFVELSRADATAALVTVVEGPDAGARLLVEPDGTTLGSLGRVDLDARATAVALEVLADRRSARRGRLFVDVSLPRPRLTIVGAGDHAVALVALADAIGWRACVVDPRSAFAAPERFPAAEEVLAQWPDVAFARLGPFGVDDAIVVLSHDHRLDDSALALALASSAGYVGAMGSRRVVAERAERLRAAGVPEVDLDRVHAPVGLDLGALTAGETALSILAEVVAVRRGRRGAPLVSSEGPIHGGAP